MRSNAPVERPPRDDARGGDADARANDAIGLTPEVFAIERRCAKRGSRLRIVRVGVVRPEQVQLEPERLEGLGVHDRVARMEPDAEPSRDA